MRAFAKTLFDDDNRRSAPRPFNCPLKSVDETSRELAVARPPIVIDVTFNALEFETPVGKNCTKMFAFDPDGSLSKTLRSLTKLVPKSPRTVPIAGMKISFVVPMLPAIAPFANAGVLTVSVNADGLQRSCCACAGLILVVPVRRPFVAAPPPMTTGVPPAVLSVSPETLVPRPVVRFAKLRLKLFVPAIGASDSANVPAAPFAPPPFTFALLSAPLNCVAFALDSCPLTAPFGNCGVEMTKKKFCGFCAMIAAVLGSTMTFVLKRPFWKLLFVVVNV